ncbi:hypothetical protein GIB67_041614 [Kingdonia uniflora]|uniref:C2H2-type domain-containing protein n=1 Tax=Kingdonia uniflora TaxID=39325 RepID=A0A7J7MQJ4_9MAGN|nr:hypothetical protein GIB67_041614 [Kingdonia uniflora]
MMMKGLMIQQQQQQQQLQVLDQENMFNLTSTTSSHEANEGGTMFPQLSFASPLQSHSPAMKKKRNLPGNPDPDAEVIALSPKTLMATNRFVCEVCNKGFQRDQNLQLHRRGHNLPWKLKQRSGKEIRKRVYVCPERGCVHHEPSRALGDLTGIKKHFCRKHGEKKWKCDKCSKRYAVQSDWKAHSKTCGTREYRCDCGTLFSRRDSFITHRAFCDALAEESARAITANPLQPSISTQLMNLQPHFMNTHDLHQAFSFKREQQEQQEQVNLRSEIPQWLVPPPPIDLPASIFSTRLEQDENSNINQTSTPNLPPYQPSPSPYMSATALLQKAAQMGATISSNSVGNTGTTTAAAAATTSSVTTNTAGFGLGLPSHSHSHEEMESGFVQSLTTFRNKASVASGLVDHISATAGGGTVGTPSLFQDMMMGSLSYVNGFDGSSFEEAFGGMLNSRGDVNSTTNGNISTTSTHLSINDGGGNEGLTRDFLGLRSFSHREILNFAVLDQCMSSSSPYDQQNQNKKPWQG